MTETMIDPATHVRIKELLPIERLYTVEQREVRDRLAGLLADMDAVLGPELQQLLQRFKQARPGREQEAWDAFAYHRDCCEAARKPIIDQILAIDSIAPVRMVIPAMADG